MLYSREHILNSISDVHKDARGFRPQCSYDHLSDEDLNSYFESLLDEIDIAIAQEKADSSAALAEWEIKIYALVAKFHIDFKTAVRWDMEHQEDKYSSCNVGYYLWENGINEIDAYKIEQKLAN